MRQSRRPWSVLVVDDSAQLRDAVCDWMTTLAEFEIVGTASDGEEAIRRVEGLRPDLVLMDANMPTLDGFSATRRMKSRAECPKIVIISFYDSDIVRREAWAAGADGFVPKADLMRSLPGIVRGLAWADVRSGSGPDAPPVTIRGKDDILDGP